MATYDVIVLGAGAMGTAAAYYLAKRGQKVLLLEQFELDHRWGSSYGYSRIIRYSYDVPDYIALAQDNYPLWFALEEEAGETLFVKTGGIDFGMADDLSLNDTIRSVQSSGLAHEVLDAEEARRRFPQYTFADGMKVLYQPDSGLLRASAAVKAHARLAEQHGATLHTGEAVSEIIAGVDEVTVVTAQARYQAARLVVTAGTWAGALLRQTGLDLPLTPLRTQLSFFEPHAEPELHDASQMPVFIYHPANDIKQTMYGLPSYQQTGVKAAFNGGPPTQHPVDYTPTEAATQDVRDAIGDYIPSVKHGRLMEARICLYTETPDRHFILDHHPEHKHIVIGSGFSGHGFKFSTIIGKILSDLALDGATPHGISLYRLSRLMSV